MFTWILSATPNPPRREPSRRELREFLLHVLEKSEQRTERVAIFPPIHGTPTWRIIPVSEWLITMVIVSPLSRVVPLPNGLFIAYKGGLHTNYLLTGMILQATIADWYSNNPAEFSQYFKSIPYNQEQLVFLSSNIPWLRLWKVNQSGFNNMAINTPCWDPSKPEVSDPKTETAQHVKCTTPPQGVKLKRNRLRCNIIIARCCSKFIG